MNPDDYNRFQALDLLRKAAYERFNDRRSYEFKISLAIWTALAVLSAGMIQVEKFPLQGRPVEIVGAVVGLAIVLVHVYWNNGIARANNIDQAVSFYFEKEMQLRVGTSFDKDLQSEIDKAKDRRKKWQSWSRFLWLRWAHLTQITITLVLSTAAVAILWVLA